MRYTPITLTICQTQPQNLTQKTSIRAEEENALNKKLRDRGMGLKKGGSGMQIETGRKGQKRKEERRG